MTDFMSKTKTPSPETITINQLASLANLTPRRIVQLGEEGKIPRPENGRLPMVQSIKELFAYYQAEGQTLQREKMLKTTAERKLREHELGVTEGKLINAAIAQNTLNAALKRYHGVVKTELERLKIRAITDFHASLGLTDVQKVALHGFHIAQARSTIDKIESVCELIGRGEDAPAHVG
jgi:hypothetical protein